MQSLHLGPFRRPSGPVDCLAACWELLIRSRCEAARRIRLWTVSTGKLIIGAVLAVVWAILGYRLSENDRRVLGRTPWGLPSALWAFLWALFLPLGLVLYLVAHSIGVRHAHGRAPVAGSSAITPPAPSPPVSAADMFPAYPRPANSEPAVATSPQPTTVAADESPGRANSSPAWHPDPSGRFHFRWWDGHEWTSHVSTDGQHLIDTNPDQRIGPY
jgi:hypothetical protein